MRFAPSLIVLAACSALFPPKRSKGPPDTWSLKAAVLHTMMTAPATFVAAKPDCSAAPMPDLQLFCEKQCDKIGELSLKAYCAWDCDDIKNPDLGVICKLEVKRTKKQIAPAECDAIDQPPMKEHCKAWVATLPQTKK
jgi:hypothetical protein